jgi:hypothetical protein
MLLISTAVIVFAIATPALGAIITLPALTLLTMAASRLFTVNAHTLLFTAFLTTFCIVLFIKGLGLSIPVLGRFLGV